MKSNIRCFLYKSGVPDGGKKMEWHHTDYVRIRNEDVAYSVTLYSRSIFIASATSPPALSYFLGVTDSSSVEYEIFT